VALRALNAGDAAFISAIARGGTLAEALNEARAEEPAFDLEPALRDHLVGGTFQAL
jgi:hypothetical protein